MLVKSFSVLLGGSLILVAGTLGYMVSDRQIPFEVMRKEVLTEKVKPGETLQIEYEFTQTQNCFVHSDRAIIDSTNVRHILEPMEFEGGFGPIGVKQQITVKLPIPSDIALGKAMYVQTTVYKCNLVQWVWPLYSPYRPTYFEVVPR